jgi:predicted MFS family arabinose efflux permease
MHLPPSETSQAQSDDYLVSKRYAWFVFAMTFALMLFDFFDRQIVVSMFPHLKAEWDLSDKQLGALVSVVSITVALGTVPISLLADRWSRVKSICVMATVWSLATIACAFTRNYGQLFAGRAAIGLGEAGYGSAAGALLASIFPQRLRSTILGALLAAASLGSVLGVILGGFISQHWGWRAAFGIVGFPGLVLALMFLFVRDYKTVPLPAARGKNAAAKPGSVRVIAVALLEPRTALLVCLGSAMHLFVLSTMYTWMPSFLNRYYGLAPDQAGLKAAIVILLGAVGAVIWGMLADRAGRRQPRRKLYLVAGACLLTLALLSFAFGALPPGPLQFALIAAGGFGLTCTIGAVPAVVMDVIHPGLRATAAAMVTLIQNLLGLAAGAFVAGMLSDALGLQNALAVIPLASLGAALLFIIAARTYEADKQRLADIHLSVDDAAPRPALA